MKFRFIDRLVHIVVVYWDCHYYMKVVVTVTIDFVCILSTSVSVVRCHAISSDEGQFVQAGGASGTG